MSVQWYLCDMLSHELLARGLGEPQVLGLIQCEKETKALFGVLAPQVHRFEFEGGQPCEIAGVQTGSYSAMFNRVTHAVRHHHAAHLRLPCSETLQAAGNLPAMIQSQRQRPRYCSAAPVAADGTFLQDRSQPFA